MAAVMAHQTPIGFVVGQPHGTAGTLRGFTALGTHRHAAGAPAVDEQNGLFSPVEILFQLLQQLRSNDLITAGTERLLPIGNDDSWQCVLIETLAQPEEMVVSRPGMIHGFH